VKYLDNHADGPYAWFVKVSGSISEFPNTLIPSTVDALTNDNYRDRNSSRDKRKANTKLFKDKHADLLCTACLLKESLITGTRAS